MTQYMLKERKRLEKLRNEIQTQLLTLPEGKLICSHFSKGCKLYHKTSSNRTYLPKSKRPIAEKLAYKRYLTLLLEEVAQEINAIDFYLRHHPKEPLKSSQLLTDIPEYKELLSSYFTPIAQELADWKAQPYETNPTYPEYRIHKSISGNLVRSKSEALIDMLLYTNKIPYRYECALPLEGLTLYPDFTIRHPITGKTYYWEPNILGGWTILLIVKKLVPSCSFT